VSTFISTKSGESLQTLRLPDVSPDRPPTKKKKKKKKNRKKKTKKPSWNLLVSNRCADGGVEEREALGMSKRGKPRKKPLERGGGGLEMRKDIKELPDKGRVSHVKAGGILLQKTPRRKRKTLQAENLVDGGDRCNAKRILKKSRNTKRKDRGALG